MVKPDTKHGIPPNVGQKHIPTISADRWISAQRQIPFIGRRLCRRAAFKDRFDHLNARSLSLCLSVSVSVSLALALALALALSLSRLNGPNSSFGAEAGNFHPSIGERGFLMGDLEPGCWGPGARGHGPGEGVEGLGGKAGGVGRGCNPGGPGGQTS